MFDTPTFSIKVESPLNDEVRGLVERAAAETEDARDEIFAPNVELLVARLNGVAVGCVALLDHLRFGEARRLYVEPEVRGNGIGAALVEALEDAAREIGIRVLQVMPFGDAHMSRDRLAHLGFQPAGSEHLQKQL